jgi:predicted DNA-binding transcriptional regulator AlpA
MHPAEHRKLISAPQAADYLGLSASTLSKRRVFGGGPKYLKLGRRVVYDTRDLDDWLDAHRRASTSDAREGRRAAARASREGSWTLGLAGRRLHLASVASAHLRSSRAHEF